jgi:hypothetical protein
VIIEFGAELGNLLRLRGLALRWQSGQLLNLLFNDIQGRLELLPEIIAIRAQLQELVAVTVQVRVTVIRLAKDLFNTVQLFLPAFDMSLDVGANAIVCALGDLGGVDLRRCGLGRLCGRRRRLRGRRRRGLCNGAPVTERRKNEARNDPLPQNHEVGP